MSESDKIQAIASIPIVVFALYQTYLFYQMYQIMKYFKSLYARSHYIDTFAKPLRA